MQLQMGQINVIMCTYNRVIKAYSILFHSIICTCTVANPAL